MVAAQGTLDRWEFPAEPGDEIFIWDTQAQRYDGYYFDDFELRWVPSPPPITVGSAFYVFKEKAADWVETFSIIPKQRRLVSLDAAVPIFREFFGRRNFERTNDAETEELRVGVIPDALWQLRVLHFPRRAGSAARGAPECEGIIIP
jgi:hypothetical protein